MTSGAAAAPSAPIVKDLLDSVSSGVTTTGSGVANYLSSLPVTNNRAGGAGITSYLSSVPANSARMGGAGIGSYLDSIHQACDAHPTSECAQAITSYLDALSTGAAP